MISRLCSIGLISVFLFLGACGGGGSGGQTPDTDSQSITSGSSTPAGTDTSAGSGKSAADPVTTGTLSVGWVAPASRSNGDALALSEISSYTVYFGTSNGNYPYSVAVQDASTTTMDIPNLPAGTYYLVITATDSQGRESGYSNVAVKTIT